MRRTRVENPRLMSCCVGKIRSRLRRRKESQLCCLLVLVKLIAALSRVPLKTTYLAFSKVWPECPLLTVVWRIVPVLMLIAVRSIMPILLWAFVVFLSRTRAIDIVS